MSGEQTHRRPSVIARLFRIKEVGLFVSLLLLLAFILLSGPQARAGFAGTGNIENLSRQIALLAIFAIGETFVIITAGIDLSLGSLIAFTGTLSATLLVKHGMGLGPTILIVLGISAVIGALHGLFVTKAHLAPFVVTLASMLILRGFGRVLSPNQTIAIPEDQFAAFNFLGNGVLRSSPHAPGLPLPVVFMVMVAIPSIFMLRYSAWGRYLLALGGNEEATRLSGVNVQLMKTLAYVVCSLLAGLSGILDASYNRVGDPRAGMMYELRAIAAAVIGGASLMGGEGSIIGTILGACIFGVIYNGINIVLTKNASIWENVIVGAVVIVAALIDVVRQRRQRG
ncbi:MAG: ABC transporter permease [Candidatus Zipacnadales bacterium]